jgi:hypothetical protein
MMVRIGQFSQGGGNRVSSFLIMNRIFNLQVNKW